MNYSTELSIEIAFLFILMVLSMAIVLRMHYFRTVPRKRSCARQALDVKIAASHLARAIQGEIWRRVHLDGRNLPVEFTFLMLGSSHPEIRYLIWAEVRFSVGVRWVNVNRIPGLSDEHLRLLSLINVELKEQGCYVTITLSEDGPTNDFEIADDQEFMQSPVLRPAFHGEYTRMSVR